MKEENAPGKFIVVSNDFMPGTPAYVPDLIKQMIVYMYPSIALQGCEVFVKQQPAPETESDFVYIVGLKKIGKTGIFDPKCFAVRTGGLMVTADEISVPPFGITSEALESIRTGYYVHPRFADEDLLYQCTL